VELRSYAELASENETALVQLRQRIDSISGEQELYAVLSLFLEEWMLLGKARVRQTVAPLVKQMALRTVTEQHDSATKAAALSLLRSQFTDDFFEALILIAVSALKDLPLLGRAVLHTATLSPSQRGNDECIRFFDVVQDRGPAVAKTLKLADKELTQYMNLVEVCSTMSMDRQVQQDAQGLTPRRAASRVLELIQSDPLLRHDMRPFVNFLAKRGESLKELSTDTFALHSTAWKSKYLLVLSKQLLPWLVDLRGCLRYMSAYRSVNAAFINYLTNTRTEKHHLLRDVGLISTALDFLGHDGGAKVLVVNLAEAAQRIDQHLLNEHSTLTQILKLIKGPTVADFLTEYRDRIYERLKSVLPAIASPEVLIENLACADQKRHLFIPLGVLEECTTHILNNLETKAFPSSAETANEEWIRYPKVVLAVEEVRNNGHDTCVVVAVRNNGRELLRNVEFSDAGKRAARHIKLFGGDFEQPIRLQEYPWRVAQKLVICLW